MFNSSAVAIGAATMAVLGAAIWGGGGPGSAESKATAGHSAERRLETLTVRWEQVGFKAVDLGPKGDSPGDFFLFSQKWRNEAGTRVIGRALARCEIGLPPSRRTCEVTGNLDGRGKIRMGGTFFGEQDLTGVITGGTGDFLGVGGEVQLDAKNGLFIFEFVR